MKCVLWFNKKSEFQYNNLDCAEIVKELSTSYTFQLGILIEIL